MTETSVEKAAKQASSLLKSTKAETVAEDTKSDAPVQASVSVKASAEPKTPRRKAAPKVEAAPKAAPAAKDKAALKAKATSKAKTATEPQAAAKKKAAATKQAAPASDAAPEKPKRAKKEAVKKEKVVRDSFTMPKSDYAKIAALKQKCLDAGVSVKKSEVLRAGLLLLEGATLNSLLAAISAVETVKTGRPSTT